jgi:hypothetical protein
VFEGIVAEKGKCDHCHKLHLLAYIPHDRDDFPYESATGDRPLRLCVGCISGLQRLTYYLRRLEAEPPKKARKRASRAPRPTEPYRGPDKHTVGSLVPATEDRSP